MNKSEKGKLGEDFCEAYFIKRGYKIISRNYHSRYGEIDLIVEDKAFLVFVEVKARNVNSISLPREAVTTAKQRKMILTAQQFLFQENNTKQPRFDVFEIWLTEGRINKFNHIENAFDETALGGNNGLF